MSKPPAAPFWSVALWSAILVLVFFVIWLVLEPSDALRVFWYGLIPLLPVAFFVNPRLWRGVCPLATLNQFGNRFGKQRALPPRMALALNVVGMMLFYLLVPARHFLFNQDGPALAIAVVALGGLAVALGAVFTVRSAFCNALCPILPVELLYGMSPLVKLDRSRCTTCTVCTPRGCIDLAGRKTISQRLGPARRTVRWVTTPHSVFFAALPGFVFGYFQVKDGSLSTAGAVYTVTFGWSLASFAVIGILVLVLRLSSRWALPLIAVAAGGIYYWYTGPTIAAQLAAPEWLAVGIRTAALGLVAVWLARAFVSADVV